MLLRVLGQPSGVSLVLGPEFPEVAHRSPSLNWSGGGGRGISTGTTTFEPVSTGDYYIWYFMYIQLQHTYVLGIYLL